MNNSKGKIIVKVIVEKIQLVLGIAILFSFGFFTINAFLDSELASEGFLEFCIVCDIVGIILIVISRKKHRLMSDYKKYVLALSSNQTGSITKLAASMGISEDIVRKNLRRMIKRKYFTNAFINQESDCIIINNSKSNPMVQAMRGSVHPQQVQQSALPRQCVSVTCKTCGTVNKALKGQTCVCEFCRSPIII